MISNGDIRKRIDKLYRERAIDVAKRYSRGNYCISQGLMVTKEELDEYFGPRQKEVKGQ